MRTEEILRTVGSVAHDVVAPRSADWDSEGRWPAEGMEALQKAGLGGLMVPREHGGHGESLGTLLRACEILARADGSTALCFGMHCVATACIAAKANAWQVEHLLRPIAEGRHLTTLALSEPGTGSHFYLPETRLEHVGDRLRLEGEKSFVTNGGHVDSYVVSTVASDPAAPVGHFSMVAVPASQPGLRWGGPWRGWGMRGNDSRSVHLDGVEVPSQALLGEEGDQIWYVFHVVAPTFLIAMTGTYLGLGDRGIEEAVNHLRERRFSHSGGALAEIWVLQHRVGQLWALQERTRQLARWAAAESAAGGPDALRAVCAAKAEVGHAANEVLGECMTLLGGQGYAGTGVIERLVRDARAAHVMSPTTDMLYTWVGRSVLGLPLLGD